jgi:hypothetical protein
MDRDHPKAASSSRSINTPARALERNEILEVTEPVAERGDGATPCRRSGHLEGFACRRGVNAALYTCSGDGASRRPSTTQKDDQ